MKSLKPYSADAATLDRFQRQLASGADPGQVIEGLRSAGLDKPDTVRFLSEFGAMRLGEAHDRVQSSAAWKDRHAADEQFQQSVQQTLEVLAGEETVAA